MSYAPDEAAAHPLFRADFHADPPVKTFKHFEGAHNTEMTGGIGHSMETSMESVEVSMEAHGALHGGSWSSMEAPWRLHGGPWRPPWRSVEPPWRPPRTSMEAHAWRSVEVSMEVSMEAHGGSMEVRGDLHGGR